MDVFTARLRREAVEQVEAAVSHFLSTTSVADGVDAPRWAAEQVKREAFAYAQRVDTESSGSRQHYIDTGRYLRVGEAAAYSVHQ